MKNKLFNTPLLPVQWLHRRSGGGHGSHLTKPADSAGAGPKAKPCCWDTLSPCLGTALLGCPQGWELTPSPARRYQGAGDPLLLPLSTSGSHLDAVPIGGEVPQRPPRQTGAEATVAVLDIFEDQMRFVIVFSLSFLPLYFVTDKGERKPKLSF